MSDDKKISQLISKSLRLKLSGEEAAEVEASLAENEQSRNFAELSALIEQSVAFGAGAVDEGDSLGLSSDAKERMKASIAEASEEKLRLSNAGLLSTGGISGKTRALSPASLAAMADESKRSRAERDEELEVRRVVSQFRLIRKLGEGGLGNVWLARDEKLNRTVAIKELRQESMESPAAWSRFQREAEITGRLEHPNIVPLYQYGDDRHTNEPFYAMRFVGKRTLGDAIVEYHDRIEAGQDTDGLGLHRLLVIFLDVCQAIAYAHSRGVVHRDIKPENVALDNFGQVVVLDWGLAKLLEDGELMQQMSAHSMPSDSVFAHTMDGDVVGTPLYMAPEQALGKLDQVSQQTDVYGLGAVLFSILTGKAPHEKTAADLQSKGVKEVLKAIATRPTPKAREFKGDISSELEAICNKAMFTKRHLRYESVGDLSADLERWMAGQNEKQSLYENVRMEGRELRAALQSFVNDSERNVRFMSHLPPIQEIIKADSDEDVNIWRERLITIFRGLLEANPDYTSVIYSSVKDKRFSELVRVERHRKDRSHVRSTPRSRLRSDEVSDYLSWLSEENREEVVVSLVCDPTCEKTHGSESNVGLVAGIPIFDDRNEESFGVIMINCDIDRVLQRQLRDRRLRASRVVVACDTLNVMAHVSEGVVEASNHERVADIEPSFLPAVEALQSQDEYIDEADSDIYGARIWLNCKHGLMYLLKRKNG